MNVIDMEEIKEINEDHGRFFFTSGTMRFFNSEPFDYGYMSEDKRMIVFVDSTQFMPSSGEAAPREYHVRFMDARTGVVSSNRGMTFSSEREAGETAEEAAMSYDTLQEAGAELIMPDTNRRAWFVAYGLPDSCHVHVHNMEDGEEFHVFSVAGEVGEFTLERAGEVMQEHTWTEYPSDL